MAKFGEGISTSGNNRRVSGDMFSSKGKLTLKDDGTENKEKGKGKGQRY